MSMRLKMQNHWRNLERKYKGIKICLSNCVVIDTIDWSRWRLKWKAVIDNMNRCLDS